MEALLGRKSAFTRTPKYCLESRKDSWERKVYSPGSGWTPVVELLHGIYFSLILYFAFTGPHSYVVPFLTLFVTGYFYLGGMSLFQKPWRRWVASRPSGGPLPNLSP